MGLGEIFALSWSGYMALALFVATRYRYRETYSFTVIPILHPIRALVFGMLAAPVYLVIILLCFLLTTAVLYITLAAPVLWLSSFVPGFRIIVFKLLEIENRNELRPVIIKLWDDTGLYWEEVWKER